MLGRSRPRMGPRFRVSRGPIRAERIKMSHLHQRASGANRRVLAATLVVLMLLCVLISCPGKAFAGSSPAGTPGAALPVPAAALRGSQTRLCKARNSGGLDAGGGTRTPDTRIMIPANFGLAIGNSTVVGHAVGHNRTPGTHHSACPQASRADSAYRPPGGSGGRRSGGCPLIVQGGCLERRSDALATQTKGLTQGSRETPTCHTCRFVLALFEPVTTPAPVGPSAWDWQRDYIETFRSIATCRRTRAGRRHHP